MFKRKEFYFKNELNISYYFSFQFTVFIFGCHYSGVSQFQPIKLNASKSSNIQGCCNKEDNCKIHTHHNDTEEGEGGGGGKRDGMVKFDFPKSRSIEEK